MMQSTMLLRSVHTVLVLAATSTGIAAQERADRQFAFVIHYDGTQVKLNRSLLTSAASPVWKEWSAGQQLEGWSLDRIVDASGQEQPSGAYAGMLQLTMPATQTELAAATAKKFLGELEDRLGELLAMAPRDHAERRLAALRAEIDECTRRSDDLAERLMTQIELTVPNPERPAVERELQEARIEREETATSLRLLDEQLQEQAKQCQQFEASMARLHRSLERLEKDNRAQAVGTDPEKALWEAQLLSINQQAQQTADELSRASTIMTELTARKREVVALRAVLEGRTKRLEQQVETMAQAIVVAEEVEDRQVARALQTIESRISALHTAAIEVEHELRRIVSPRVTPWF